MIEINGKFLKWLKAKGHNPNKIQDVTHKYPIESLDGLSCIEIIQYMESLVQVHGENAVYNEHWTGYEDFYPEVLVSTEETDEDYEYRVKELRRKYDKEVFDKRKAMEAERKKIEDQVKVLEEQLAKLKG